MIFKKIRATLLLVSAAALLAGLAVACGGDDDDDGGDSKPVEIPAGAPMVDQDDLTFIPNKLTVKVGEKVYFKNSETAIHTVTINSKNVSGNMKENDVVIWIPEKSGDYKVTCDYHPQMKATITVE
ncbi:MAG: cupredoxin domain-containing protein [Thermoflexaceae bacterium]|nr:cupredoxin domain-containing protein [Thermoflexaceae bacterium]